MRYGGEARGALIREGCLLTLWPRRTLRIFGNLVEQRDDLCLKGFPSPQKCQLLMDLAINVDLIIEINQTANGL